jgi:cytochrome c-type biogenesis protein CcmH
MDQLTDTNIFWLLCGAMMLVAVAWVVPPLLGRIRDPFENKRQPDLKARQTALSALDKSLADGKISADEHAGERKRLSDEVLDELTKAARSSAKSTRGRTQTGLASFILVALPAASIGLYAWLGTSEAFQEQFTPVASSEAAQAQAGSISEMVDGLAQRLAKNPDDAEGWIMLARSYMVMERYDQAADAYSQAHTLTGDQPVLLVDFAEAVTLANDNQMEGLPTRLLDRALAIEPQHQKGIWLAGFAAMQREDAEKAVQLWKQLLEQLTPGSPEATAVSDMIAQVRGEATSPAASTQAVDGASLVVTVVLDPELAGKITGEETLFIFARAVDGPPMPLAIQRRTASELPLTITLDDSMSMLPAMTLSGFPIVTVGARISKSGDAIGQSGDLQGILSPVDVAGTAAVEVTISKVLP